MNIHMAALFSTMTYLAIGLFIYMVGYSPETFSWNDPWIYIISVLWPFALMWELTVIVFYFAVIATIIGLMYLGYEWIKEKLGGS